MECVVDGIQTVYVIVADLERSVAFYEMVVGKVVSTQPWGAFFELPDGTRLILQQQNEAAAGKQRMWFELLTADPEAAHKELQTRGIPIKAGIHTTPGGSTAFQVEDPDGNEIRIGTRWPLAVG